LIEFGQHFCIGSVFQSWRLIFIFSWQFREFIFSLMLTYAYRSEKILLFCQKHLFCNFGTDFESRRMIYSYFDFGRKNSSFRLPYRPPSSSADCARELLNGSKESVSLVDYTRKKCFGWGVRIFCVCRHKWSSFRVILAHVARPGAQPLGQGVLLKISVESRLESESFEPLIDFLAFLVQKLWSKINKIINYLIS